MSSEGNSVIFGSMATVTVLSAGAVDAHFRGIAAMRAAREEDRIAELARDAEELGNLAVQLSQALAAERIKNENLTKALHQRQAFIDRMRNRASQAKAGDVL